MASSSAYGIGVVATDRRNHAIKHTWTGWRALCGAGRIIVTLRGDFIVTDSVACQECAAKIREQGS